MHPLDCDMFSYSICALAPAMVQKQGNDQHVRNFACSICGKAYVRKDTLQRHQQLECGKEPQFSCPFCDYRAKQKVHCLIHISRKHPSLKEKMAVLYQRQEHTTIQQPLYQDELFCFFHWSNVQGPTLLCQAL